MAWFRGPFVNLPDEPATPSLTQGYHQMSDGGAMSHGAHGGAARTSCYVTAVSSTDTVSAVNGVGEVLLNL